MAFTPSRLSRCTGVSSLCLGRVIRISRAQAIWNAQPVMAAMTARYLIRAASIPVLYLSTPHRRNGLFQHTVMLDAQAWNVLLIRHEIPQWEHTAKATLLDLISSYYVTESFLSLVTER